MAKASARTGRLALDPDAREQQMIGYAIDLAERQLREGTASSQVITHYLKLGSSKERLEREKLEEENKLLRARTQSILEADDTKEMVQAAIAAFSRYSGQKDIADD